VNLGRIKKEEVSAQIVLIQDHREGGITISEESGIFDEKIRYIPMTASDEKDMVVRYTATYKAQAAGKFNYGIRIVPYHSELESVVDLNLVYWA
jgi:hypothetical protein